MRLLRIPTKGHEQRLAKIFYSYLLVALLFHLFTVGFLTEGPIKWTGLARLTEMKAFTRDPGVNRSCNVLYTFDYMASGLARLTEIPSAAYRASPAKRAGG